jgi:FkbM family methyltransferase
MSLRGLARFIVRHLPAATLYEVFYQSARALGVRSYQAGGAAGWYFGPLYDQSVIKTYLRTGAWSQNILDLFLAFFGTQGGTMYDIGANIGLISIPIARDPRVRVVAFEPDAHNCALLRANVAVNGVAVEIVNAAVSDRRGTAHFSRSEYNSGDHRLSADGTVAVATVTLADHPPGPGRFGVKIDTQGAEPLIFKGGEQVLAAAGLIVTEFWPWGMRRMGLDPDFVLAFAERHFDHGHVLRHDEAIGAPLPVAEIVARLREVVAAGGETDAVDLVLMRQAAAPGA